VNNEVNWRVNSQPLDHAEETDCAAGGERSSRHDGHKRARVPRVGRQGLQVRVEPTAARPVAWALPGEKDAQLEPVCAGASKAMRVSMRRGSTPR